MGQQKKPVDNTASNAVEPPALDWNPTPVPSGPKPPSLQEKLKSSSSTPPATKAAATTPPPIPAPGGADDAKSPAGKTADSGAARNEPPHPPTATGTKRAAASKPALPTLGTPPAPASRHSTAPAAGEPNFVAGPARDPSGHDVAPKDDTAGRRKAKRRPAGPSRTQIAANDDAPSIGGLIYALNQTPSNRPFVIAAIASAVWLIAGIVLGYITLGPDIAAATSVTDFLRTSSFITTVSGILGPILLVWFLAFLAWRSEELHLRSTAMTEVAVRLAEPDRMAEGQVSSLGQTVRREVDYMNEAVTQALDRASELDAMMKSEVAALERSYEDNERKIRGLLQELASERNSLTGTGEHFRQTLSHLAEDVPVLIERLSQQQSKLSGLVMGAGENLTALEQSLSQQTTRLETTLESRSEQMQSLLTSRTEELDAALNAYASQINTRADDVKVLLASQAENVEQTLGDYASALGTILDQRTNQITGQLEQSSRGLNETLTARTDQMAERLEATNTQISQRLLETGKSIEGELDRRMQSIDDKAGQIGQRLMETGKSIDGELDRRMQSIDEIISQRTEMLQNVFEEYALALDTTLANRATALDTQLVERTKALDEAFNERLQLFDEAIVRSTAAIDSSMSENAKALTSNIEAHANVLSDTIGRQAADLDANLLRGISSVRETSENISRQSIRAIEGLAGQADMLKTVSENLLGQINTVTTRFENQGQSILRSANALESANYKIDKALGARTEALNETLDKLSSKAQEIGSAVDGYSTEIESRFSDAEQRTRLLTQELSREAEQRSRSTIDEISRLKQDALREKDRALEELREEFETVTREVTERLAVLSNQFSQTSGDVRSNARRAAEGIEADQARLKAQLDQLPAATKETSDAMRRALNDQLRAIDQLTQYARATGAARDVRAPMAGAGQEPVPTSQPTQPTQRRSLSSLTSTLTNEINERTARASESRAVVPTPQPAQQPAAQQPQPAPAPQSPQTAMPPTAAAAGSKAWMMGDLLARASLDDDPDMGAALDIPAIARAMDPSLAAAIFARVQAGQRGFMVTSIYPQRSRALFTETQERYARGGAFRGNVDQFLTDFDAMLQNAQAQDASGKAANELIVSESGRVYLFLSHASGRLT